MRTFYRLCSLVILLGVLLWQAAPAAAQEQPPGSLVLGVPETDAFPLIRFPMEAYDAQGHFLSRLKASQVEVLEDGNALALDKLTSVPTGLQITVALNTHPSMNTPINGISPYTEIQTALADWASAQQSSTRDDFSLATPTGLFLIRSTDPQQWQKAILEYQPDLLKGQPNLTSLADALDLATDPLGSPQMKRAIVFITPPLPPAQLTNLPDYTSRAKQIGVKVFVWMVAPTSTAEGADTLQDLAVQTGGQFNLLVPDKLRPEIESQLIDLRTVYQAQYTSQVKTSGTHRLTLRLKDTNFDAVSNEQSMALTVLPPNPIFLSPPAALQFQVNAPTQPGQSATLTPEDVHLKIMIEFPDQHQRALKATRLFVNGQLVAENLQAPFDRFVWNVAEITQSGQQMLRVEALDALGISGSSLEIPVEVEVQSVESPIIPADVSSRQWMTISSVVVAGAALALVLITSGRKNKFNWRNRQIERSRSKDPITQPVPGQGIVDLNRKKARRPKPAGSHEKNGKQAAAAHGSVPAPARLVALMDDEQPVPGGTIPLFTSDVTFGSDSEHALQVLTSPTVDNLHARIFTNPQGQYVLVDQNSVAGTWINYTPVGAQGSHLEDGDLVHIGRVMFRFEQFAADPSRRPVQVIELEPQPPADIVAPTAEIT